MNSATIILCLFVVVFAISSTFSKNILGATIILWLEGMLVTALLFLMNNEYLGITTLVVSTIAVATMSVMTGTVRGDLRADNKTGNVKKQVIIRFVGAGMAALCMLPIGYVAQKTIGAALPESAPAIAQTGMVLMTKFKPVAIMIGIFVVTAIIGVALIVYVTDRETT